MPLRRSARVRWLLSVILSPSDCHFHSSMTRKGKAMDPEPALVPAPRLTRAAAAAVAEARLGVEAPAEHLDAAPARKAKKGRGKRQAGKQSRKKAVKQDAVEEQTTDGEAEDEPTSDAGAPLARPVTSRAATRARLSQVYVELPGTPKAVNRRAQDSVSGAGRVAESLPPSSSPAPSLSPPAPAPLFPPAVAQAARARDARNKAQEAAARGPSSALPRTAHNSREEEEVALELTEEDPDGENSGSNYSEGVAARAARDARKVTRGEEVVRTEDEDAEDEREFEQEVATPVRTFKGPRTTKETRSRGSPDEEDVATTPVPHPKRAVRTSEKFVSSQHTAHRAPSAASPALAPDDDEISALPGTKKRRGGFSKPAKALVVAPSASTAPALSDQAARSAKVAQDLFGGDSPRREAAKKPRQDVEDVDRSDQDDDIEDGEEEEDTEGEDWPRIRGAFSKAGKEAAQQLGRDFNKAVDDIAREYGKSRKIVLQHTGVTLQATRAPNSFCKYSIWYANKHPISDAHDPTTYAAEISTNYHKLVDGLSKQERKKALLPIMQWVEDLEAGKIDGADSRKAASAMMKAAQDQLDALCRVYQTHGIVICGALLSTSSDPAARQMAKIFGTAPELLDFVAANKVNMWECIDFLQTCIVCQRYSNEGVHLPLPQDFQVPGARPKDKGKQKDDGEGPQDGKDKKRDGLRHEAKTKLLRRLQRHVRKQESFPWTGWANVAWDNKLAIDNWPAGVAAPGPKFNWKGLSVKDLEKVVAGLDEEDDENRLDIVAWNDDDVKLAEAMDNRVSRVGVVFNTDGNVVREVFDSATFSKAKKNANKRKAADAAHAGPTREVQLIPGEEERRPMVPLPRRSAGADPNPVPRKRKRVEDGDGSNDAGPQADRARTRPTGLMGPAQPPTHQGGGQQAAADDEFTLRQDKSSNPARYTAPDQPPQLVHRLPIGEGVREARRMGEGVREDRRMGEGVREDRRMGEGVREGRRMGEGVREGRRTVDAPWDRDVYDMDGQHRQADFQPRIRMSRARQEGEAMERFADDFLRYDDPPVRVPLRRYESAPPSDSEADLPEGPAAMMRQGGFHDGRGRYFVAQQGPGGISAGEHAQALRRAPRGRSRSSGMTSRSVTSSHAAPPSSVAGSSRQSENSGRSAPRANYNPHAQYRQSEVIYEEDVDDDMDLAPNIPAMYGFDPARYNYETRQS
ncbi:hypothetical protein PLICRDRAFT_180889 [Plicaturopsis crispa FD-325 SS-3]|uniref:Uncharacterized protein n=1 Tax=Plicaturopsis crispa FD-325 SS-3 TaxID=944288 RepID=A0A0C9SK13_PLICR|nr:hypothetical protein PLICRDRAFT_180889 [Plicaturopsis crispa FD-325 SS-3]